MIRPRMATALALALATVALLVAAPAAVAADGVGLWGPADDKVITFWALSVLVFFTVLVTVLSIVQIRLESRRERAREQIERLRPRD